MHFFIPLFFIPGNSCQKPGIFYCPCAKGIVPTVDGRWLHFDYVPEEHEVRFGTADYTGRLCVIGSNLKEDGLKQLFGL